MRSLRTLLYLPRRTALKVSFVPVHAHPAELELVTRRDDRCRLRQGVKRARAFRPGVADRAEHVLDLGDGLIR
jgi:hypothetical protein